MLSDATLQILTGIALIGGLVAARSLGALSSWIRSRRRTADHTIVAEYQALAVMTPAELGYCIDGNFGDNELFATILWLYAHDLVTLSAKGNDIMIGAINAQNETSIGDVESMVLGCVRSAPLGVISWHGLSSNVAKITGVQSDFKSAVVASMADKGLLEQGGLVLMLFRIRLVSILFATVAWAAFCIPLYIIIQPNFQSTYYQTEAMRLDRDVSILALMPVVVALWFGCYMYANLALHLYARHDGVPTGATKALNQLWPDVAGFQLFLKQTEFVRLQHDLDLKDPSLPYCLALGMDPGVYKALKL